MNRQKFYNLYDDLARNFKRIEKRGTLEESLDPCQFVNEGLDSKYHNVDLQAGLFHGLTEEGDAPRFTTNDLVNLSKHAPPRNTRAFGRSEVIKHVVKEGWADFLEQTAKHQDLWRSPYVINWSVFQNQGSPRSS